MLPYAIPIMLGAFLLFLIQPLSGKFILPWFGGTPAVWTTCMLFFQMLLLCGYAYAHASISGLKPRAQAAVHLVLLLAALAVLPVIPGDAWKPTGSTGAEWRILVLLLMTIGLPLFLLSATAPLLQAWFSRRHPGRSPYRLYAYSNLAALAGLVSYPFLIEPAFLLKTQAWAWSAGFALFALFCGWCALRQWSVVPEGAPVTVDTAALPATRGDRALWVGLSACGSVILLSTTSQLSQHVAVVPMLWVVPLVLYLLTFGLCFDHARWYWRPLWLTALPVAIACAMSAPYFSARTPLALQLPVYCVTLFVGCMICHGELARRKPPAAQLTAFYLWVAAGGALGGVACSLVAPAIFSGLWEYQYGIAALCLLTMLALVHGPQARMRMKPIHAWILVLGLAAAVGLGFLAEALRSQTHTLFASRNFYGVLEVTEETGRDGAVRSLIHGRVSHGFQFQDETLRYTPVTYYGLGSGLGVAESALRNRGNGTPPRIRTGAVGLGAGILAAYGRKGDAIRFYEINPEVVRLAGTYFSYLRDTAASVTVIPGDGRISLEQEQTRGESQQFDLLVLDAFGGDSVPLHLLTRQAFALYDYHLKRDGVLAVHISSQHLDLAPLIYGLARDGGREVALIEDPHRDDPRYLSSRWVLVTRDRTLLQTPSVARRTEPSGDPDQWLCFTDDYSNLFQLLRKGARPH